jgi:hypothetical protein
MNEMHLSEWDQQEYVLGQRTPDMVQHLAQCSTCQASIAQLEQGVTLFRNSALEWSARSLEGRPFRTPAPLPSLRSSLAPAWQWAVAACLLLLLLPVYLYVRNARQQETIAHHTLPQTAPNATPNSAPNSAPNDAPINDDALLQQVDEEVSESVPASMEPLTHLVTTSPDATSRSSASGRQHNAQAN